jgi:hypothetical protein
MVEGFCERASREEIQEATRVVRSLLAARGLLPEQASKKINSIHCFSNALVNCNSPFLCAVSPSGRSQNRSIPTVTYRYGERQLLSM